MASNFAEFERELDVELERDFKGRILEVTQKIAFEGYSGVIAKSRVDTGFMVNSWNVSVGGVEGGATSSPGGGALSLSESEAEALKSQLRSQRPVAIAAAKAFQEITIWNGTEYAIYHEEGTVNMAPQPMVGPTVAEIQSKYRNVR